MFKLLKYRFCKYKHSVIALKCFNLIRKKLYFKINTSDNPDVLVECILRTPKSTIEKLIISSYLLRSTKAKNVAVYFKHSRLKSNSNYEITKSFGVNNFYSIELGLLNPLLWIKFLFCFFSSLKNISSSENILKFHLKGVYIGDLLYDTIVRDNSKHYNFQNVSYLTKLKYYGQAIFLFFLNKNIWGKSDFKYLITSHKTYLRYGLLVRIALDSGATVILKDNNVFKLYDQNVNILEHFLKPKKEQVLSTLENAEKLNASKAYLKNRFSGQLDQMDVVNAFKGKNLYSREKLKESIGVSHSNKPIVFIMSHAISDSPHSSEYLHFNDYYDWLKCTLVECCKNENVIFVVKEHPSSYFWNESGVVQSIITDMSLRNIYILPTDFNTSGFVECADLILTAQGTVALESVAFKIPVITCGAGYFSSLGAIDETVSKEHYLNLIKGLSISSIGKMKNDITEVKMDKACVILYLVSLNQCHSNLVYETNILPNQDFHTEQELLWKYIYSQLNEYDIEQDPLSINCDGLFNGR